MDTAERLTHLQLQTELHYDLIKMQTFKYLNNLAAV